MPIWANPPSQTEAHMHLSSLAGHRQVVPPYGDITKDGGTRPNGVSGTLNRMRKYFTFALFLRSCLFSRAGLGHLGDDLLVVGHRTLSWQALREPIQEPVGLHLLPQCLAPAVEPCFWGSGYPQPTPRNPLGGFRASDVMACSGPYRPAIRGRKRPTRRFPQKHPEQRVEVDPSKVGLFGVLPRGSEGRSHQAYRNSLPAHRTSGSVCGSIGFVL